MASLTFAGVHKRFGDVEVLRGLELEAREGELLVLVGPSGSGKTTALRVAAGLERVSAGTIRIGSRDVTELPPARRNVSMVFQSYALFPHLTVAENIGFGLRARGIARRDAAGRVEAAARLVGCEHLLARKPFELSGGERQRVALARAVVREPDVFLLDEPLSNLDAQLRVQTRAELKRLHQRVGATTVYVTHDQVEASTLGERVAVLHEGAVQQVGPPEELYRRPANRFVATFFGSPAMNILPAVVEQGSIRAGALRVDSADADARLARRQIELGIRPEHVAIALEGEGTRACVEIDEVVGDESVLHLAVDGHTLVVSGGPELRPPVGATVSVSVPRSRAYLFDAETGETVATPP